MVGVGGKEAHKRGVAPPCVSPPPPVPLGGTALLRTAPSRGGRRIASCVYPLPRRLSEGRFFLDGQRFFAAMGGVNRIFTGSL
jgi:hypothetical protein